ncbi:MAG: glycoside hydrolase family 99-like domain-containing protein, partial [Anaerolineae bacterium]
TQAWQQAADLWLPYLQHPQCVTVANKPLILIFNPAGADQAGLAYLQQAARRAGLPGVAVAGCGSGALETGFNLRTHYNIISGYTGGAQQHTYAELVAANEAAWVGSPAQPYIPIVTAGWDKRPWEGPTGLNQAEGWFYPDRTPEQFAAFMRDALAWLDAHPEQTTAERLALIYAWNEFGEGGYLAPTKGDPDGAYLKALKSVVLPGK